MNNQIEKNIFGLIKNLENQEKDFYQKLKKREGITKEKISFWLNKSEIPHPSDLFIILDTFNQPIHAATTGSLQKIR